MSGTMFAFCASLIAVLVEFLYRWISGPWAKYLWLWVPLKLCLGYCLYRLVTGGTTLVGAFVVFTFSTTIVRVIVSTVILRETLPMGTWIALGLLVLAKVAQFTWGR